MKTLVVVFALIAFVGCASEKKVAPKVVTVSFKVDGMVCNSCEESIKTKLTKVDGVKSVQVSQPDGKAIVAFDDSKINAETLAADIQALGYKAAVQ
jgi:copper chaperone CopZ